MALHATAGPARLFLDPTHPSKGCTNHSSPYGICHCPTDPHPIHAHDYGLHGVRKRTLLLALVWHRFRTALFLAFTSRTSYTATSGSPGLLTPLPPTPSCRERLSDPSVSVQGATSHRPSSHLPSHISRFDASGNVYASFYLTLRGDESPLETSSQSILLLPAGGHGRNRCSCWATHQPDSTAPSSRPHSLLDVSAPAQCS